jgi:hypothetical protein
MLEASPTGSKVVFTIRMELLVGTGEYLLMRPELSTRGGVTLHYQSRLRNSSTSWKVNSMSLWEVTINSLK